jgi:hypothetical protein
MVSVPSKRKIKDPGERYVNRESLVYMKKLLRDQDPVARGKKIHERTGTEAKNGNRGKTRAGKWRSTGGKQKPDAGTEASGAHSKKMRLGRAKPVAETRSEEITAWENQLAVRKRD